MSASGRALTSATLGVSGIVFGVVECDSRSGRQRRVRLDKDGAGHG